MNFKIGTAGIPSSTRGKTIDGIRRVKELGLDAMEIEFVRGVYMSQEVAKTIGSLAKELGVVLTVHSPYYVNLNSKDDNVRAASKKRILESADRGALAGAFSVTFHPAYYGGGAPEVVYKVVKHEIKEIMSAAPKGVLISPETTGKLSQFGTWDELLELHKETGCGICFDFSHIWAHELGDVDFEVVLNKIKKDYKWYKDMHIHLSGIRYGEKGELKHQPFDDTKMPWKEVLRLLVEKGFGGTIICENPNPEKGALKIKEFLKSL